MPRNISFAYTKRQFEERTKTVTRRMGWLNLKAGDILWGVEKAMGLKPGETIKRLGMIKVVNVRREPLRAMIDDREYGFEECGKEGFLQPHHLAEPGNFIQFFCATHKDCTPDSTVTRIEYEYC